MEFKQKLDAEEKIYSSKRLKTRIRQLEEKLNFERKCLESTLILKNEKIDQLELNHVDSFHWKINETKKRIFFLEKQLSDIRNSKIDASILIDSNPLQHCIALKENQPLTLNRISYKIIELGNRLQKEQAYLSALDKFQNTISYDDKLSVSYSIEKHLLLREHSKQMIIALTMILQKYTSLICDDHDLPYDQLNATLMKVKRQKLTGSLDFIISRSKYLPENANFIEFLIDGSFQTIEDGIKVNSVKSSNCSTVSFENNAESFCRTDFYRHQIRLERAQELMVLWRTEPLGSIQGILIIPLDIIFKETFENAIIDSKDRQLLWEWSGAMEIEPQGIVMLCLRLNQTKSESDDESDSSIDEKQNFTCASNLNNTSTSDLTMPNRSRWTSTPTSFKLGHVFASIGHQGILCKCSKCYEFIFSLHAFKCISCNMLVHKSCLSSIFAPCIRSRSFGRQESYPIGLPQDLVKYQIPHGWVTQSLITVNWCRHCGLLLPLFKRSTTKKCKICGILVHSKCSRLMPNQCGLSSKIADSLFVLKQRKQVIDKDQNILDKGAQREKTTINNFQLLSVLGRGNFGKVFLAKRINDGLFCALKVIPKSLKPADEEAVHVELEIFNLATRFNHPFLVHLIEYFTDTNFHYFVMEYIEGGDLMFHVQRRVFSEHECRFYAAEIMLAIEFLHSHGIIYRDLKLDNLLLTPEGHIKLADYGLAKKLPWNKKKLSMSSSSSNNSSINSDQQTQTYCGTPDFMAPELILEQPYGFGVDWWAFGVLLYEMLYGRAPFHGINESELFHSILESKLKFPKTRSPHHSSFRKLMQIFLNLSWKWKKNDQIEIQNSTFYIAARNVSKNARDLIRHLLIKDPNSRLIDPAKIKAHSFFSKQIKWDLLVMQRLTVPYIPDCSNETNCKKPVHFEDQFTKLPLTMNDMLISNTQINIFNKS